jgi:VCBS repeat-containing protein
LDPAEIRLTVTLEVLHGGLTMSEADVDVVDRISAAADGRMPNPNHVTASDQSLTFTGTIGQLNAALATVRYFGDQDFNTDGPADFEELRILVDDQSNTGNASGQNEYASLTLALTVLAVNDPPVAVGDSYNTAEDTVLTVAAPGVLGNDTDIEGDVLTAVLGAGPQHGTLVFNADGSFSYTPAADYRGADAFTYRAYDGNLNSNVVTVAITVTPVNDAPVSQGNAYATDEDTVLTVAAPGVLDNDADTDGDELTAIPVAGPTYGTLVLNVDGSFSYTPNADYHGTDTFTYVAHDGILDSGEATVTITIALVNDAPVAVTDTYETDEDTVLTVAAPGVLDNDTDVESDALTALLISGPQHGTLVFDADGSFGYTPDANYHGLDTFIYVARDGELDSAVATVTITIAAVNDAPVAVGDAYTTAEDSVLTIAAAGVLANDTDVDGDVLTAVLVAGPQHGTLALDANGAFVYTPAGNYHGPDAFTYHAQDGELDSNVVTVAITVTPVNDAPVAGDDAYETDEDTPLTITAPGVLGNDTDADGDSLAAVLVSGPQHGTVAFSANGSFTYRPLRDYHGSDAFTYRVTDNQLNSSVATVAITVAPVNDAPVAEDDGYGTDEDTPLTVAAPGLLGNDADVDGDGLTAVLVAGTQHGTLTLNANGSFSYSPNPGFEGTDSFTYRAHDGQLGSNSATVSIHVALVNQPPLASGDRYDTVKNAALTIAAPGVLGNDTDREDDPLSAMLVTPPALGTLVLNADGSFTYTPAAGYVGSDSFTYRANDGLADSNVATVTIDVAAVNAPPVAVGDAYETAEDTELSIAAPGVLANDTDADGEGLSVFVVSGPEHGTLTLIADGAFTYTPAADYHGPDAFTYQAHDGELDSNVATVTITVAPVNDAPVAVGDSYATAEDTMLTLAAPGVLANDSDVDGDALSVFVVSGPQHGTLALDANGAFTYTPAAD